MSSPQTREMVFCHECQNEWYRSEHGLACPDCESEFTEVIEPEHDPREEHVETDDEMPEFPLRPPFLGMPHTMTGMGMPRMPSAGGEMSQLQVHTTGPNTYSISGYFSTFPRQGSSPPRFPYSPTARLTPRDANNPQSAPQIDELSNVLSNILASIHDHHAPRDPQAAANNPMGNLMNILFGGTGRMGDYAHSQEDIDRIITSMMEQNAMGNAPPPAAVEDISSLPKRGVTEAMLGENGRAECTICMESVSLGEEVTMLYCDHWFHEQCVGAWLREHNTCPHCRKSISEGRQQARTQSSSSRTSLSRSLSRRRSSTTPRSPGTPGGSGGGFRDFVRNHNPFGGGGGGGSSGRS